LKTLIEVAKFLRMKSGDNLDKPSVLVLAPTATAAHIIDGQTIEAGLELMPGQNTENIQQYSSLATLSYKYDQVKCLFIDEISMVGAKKFHNIHTKCQRLFEKDKPFGGLPVICCGDFLQLPPVLDSAIYERYVQKGKASFTTPHNWKIYFKQYELTEKMRSLEDPDFSTMCDKIGTNTMSDLDIDHLKERLIPCPNEYNNDAYKTGDLAIIVYSNEKREKINYEKLKLIQGPSEVFTATHPEKDVGKIPSKKLRGNYTKTGNLPYQLEVKVDCPVMLTVNVNKPDGLTNGARGYVVEWGSYSSIYSPKQEKVEIIWVKFADNVGANVAARGRKNMVTKA